MLQRRDTETSDAGTLPSGPDEELTSLIAETSPAADDTALQGTTAQSLSSTSAVHTSKSGTSSTSRRKPGSSMVMSNRGRNIATGVVSVILILSIIVGVVIGKHMPKRVLPLSDPNQDYQLQQVQVIIRHGVRTPLVTLAQGFETTWDCSNHPISVAAAALEAGASMSSQVYSIKPIPGRQALPGNCKLGQLTSEGANQHVTLGQKLRDLYIDQLGFLPEVYDETQLYIRSTDLDRTKQSAESFVLGLYPPNTRSQKEGSFVDQYIVELPAEYMFPNPDRCPALSDVIHKLEQSPAYADPVNALKPDLNAVFHNKRYPRRIEDLASILKCRQARDMALPPGFTPSLTGRVFSAADNAMKVAVENEQYLRMGMGEFVEEVYNNMVDVVNGTHKGGHKFMLYSGHDTTIAPFLALFNTYDNIWPPFAANIIIELYYNAKLSDWFFRLKYMGRVQSLSGPCDLDTGLCSLSQFAKIVQKYRLNPVECYQ